MNPINTSTQRGAAPLAQADQGFPALLRSHRQARDWSLSEAAEMIGCTKAYLWELEMGRAKNPTIKLLAGIAGAYQAPLSMVAGSAAIAFFRPEQSAPLAQADQGGET